MPSKHNKCCCCPDCTIRTELCCPCVCPAICVTFTPSNYEDCDVEADEFDWDESISGYQGTLAGHDLYYFIERDPPAAGQERGPCKFKLRSTSLGYPEGYELEWEIPCPDEYGDETPCTTCRTLQTEVDVPADPYDECAAGTISTYCVSWVTPTTCSSCHCLCECLCVDVTKDGIYYSGKACWEEYLQAYVGSLTGTDQYGGDVSLDVSFPIARWGDVCDDDDYQCDPYSDDCAIGVTLGSGEDEIAGDWQLMSEPCELRAVDYSWTITRSPYTTEDDISVAVTCAKCGECITTVEACCPDPMPRVLDMTLAIHWAAYTSGPYAPPPGEEPPDWTYYTLNLVYQGYDGGDGGKGHWWYGEVTITPHPYWLKLYPPESDDSWPHTLQVTMTCDDLTTDEFDKDGNEVASIIAALRADPECEDWVPCTTYPLSECDRENLDYWCCDPFMFYHGVQSGFYDNDYYFVIVP